MSLSKRQQALWEIVQARQVVEKSQLFEALEGSLSDRKLYRSRYNSFTKTLKKLIDSGVLEQEGEFIRLPSPATLERPKLTQTTLNVLEELRERKLPLTLANLQTLTEIRPWLEALAAQQLQQPFAERRVVDLDAVLDAVPEALEALLPHLNVEPEAILNSSWVFSTRHWQVIQQEAHSLLRQKLIKFTLTHEAIQQAIAAKHAFQPPGITLRELLEPTGKLSSAEWQQVTGKLPGAYLPEAASRFLVRWLKAYRPHEPQLEKRYPGLFQGAWEWDKLYHQLYHKVLEHTKKHGLYQTMEEWEHSLKEQVRSRFRQAQRPPHATPRSSSLNAMPNSLENAYQVLGVGAGATAEEIRIAFRKLAKAHHPDQGGDPEFFRALNQAYTRLMQYLEKPSF